MSIVIGTETVQVVQGGHLMRQVPLAPSGRAFTGKMLSAITSDRGHVREWSLRFPPMTITDVEALEDELYGPGSVLVTGALIDAADVRCYPRNIQRVMDNLVWGRVSCDLVEDPPAVSYTTTSGVSAASATVTTVRSLSVTASGVSTASSTMTTVRSLSATASGVSAASSTVTP